MITFIIGLCILAIGYIFYSNYVQKQFMPDERQTPAIKSYDGVDYIPLSTGKNLMIQLLNIAGLGPILGAIQGILFGPIAFILIPLGAILMGGVHDYFAGMISCRNNGAQMTALIKKYLGNNNYKIFTIIVGFMLLFVAAVFVYTSGDIIAQRFLGQTDFSLTNPTMIKIYMAIGMYFILAALFPIDKIIGRFYPVFTFLLLIGSLLVAIGFFTKGIQLQEINFAKLNIHPQNLHILPLFFMTISCGLLSGFHSTQSTIISRTIKNEYEGKNVFYGMMCAESLIAMIWAAAAMHVYNLKLVPENIIGTANVINLIADVFVMPYLAFIVTIAVVTLPITTGDTALRALRMMIAETINLKQNKIINRFKVVIPITILLTIILIWAKNGDSFAIIWRYFTFVNQLIAIPTFMYATIYLYQNKKNYLITLIPGLFYVYITMSFIFNANIGLNIPYEYAQCLGIITSIISCFYIFKKMQNNIIDK